MLAQGEGAGVFVTSKGLAVRSPDGTIKVTTPPEVVLDSLSNAHKYEQQQNAFRAASSNLRESSALQNSNEISKEDLIRQITEKLSSLDSAVLRNILFIVSNNQGKQPAVTERY